MPAILTRRPVSLQIGLRLEQGQRSAGRRRGGVRIDAPQLLRHVAGRLAPGSVARRPAWRAVAWVDGFRWRGHAWRASGRSRSMPRAADQRGKFGGPEGRCRQEGCRLRNGEHRPDVPMIHETVTEQVITQFGADCSETSHAKAVAERPARSRLDRQDRNAVRGGPAQFVMESSVANSGSCRLGQTELHPQSRPRWTSSDHSARSATSGSTLSARRSGRAAASRATLLTSMAV